jgi:putative sigma-54 modulation protein
VDVSVSSRHLELSEALRAAAEEKIGRLERFLDGMNHADVHFFEEKNPRIAAKHVCEVTMEGRGHHVRVKAAASDPFAAVDLAVEKLEHQLHRLKTKLVDRNHARKGKTADNGGAAAGDLDTARIVKAKRFVMEPMTPEDAVLQMELLGHDFYFFSNTNTGRTGVVYRRRSGDVGLIDEAN